MADLRWTLAQIAQMTGGALRGDGGVSVRGVKTDSRDRTDGALFVALGGARFDGHDFVRQAASGGAAAVMVERPEPELAIPQIVVADTLGALQTMGLARRRQFKGRVIAVTGSSGKTTTRKLITSICKQRHVTLQPHKNFNNHIGVPLTLLELEPAHAALVVELGCSDFGEIALLTRLCDPDVGLVTNVGPAHLEKLGDLDGVARAKGELFIKMRGDAIAVINADDSRVAAMSYSPRVRMTYGSSPRADVRLVERKAMGLSGQRLTLDIRGVKTEVDLPLLGEHNAANATAAAAAATAVGLDPAAIALGLSLAIREPGRLGLTSGPQGSLIIDDTYNANPASMGAALKALGELTQSGRALAVLGDMLELGESSEEAHRSIGAMVKAAGVSLLVTLGEKGKRICQGAREAGLAEDCCVCASSHEKAAAIVASAIRPGDVLLVKGSRGMQMEKVIASLTEAMD